MLAVTVTLVLGGALVLRVARSLTGQERRWMVAAFLVHAAAVFILLDIYTNFYGFGDMFAYRRSAEVLVDTVIRPDFFGGTWDVIGALFRQPGDLEPLIFGRRKSTGSMTAMVALVMALTGGSFPATAVVFMTLSFLGQVLFYRVAREYLPTVPPILLAVSSLGIPSVVLWSSGVVKEALAISGLGVVSWGIHGFITSSRVRGISSIALGSVVLWLFKPWLLVPVVVALVVSWVWHHHLRSSGAGRGNPFLVPVLLAALFVSWLAIGGVFPDLSVNGLSEEVAHRQDQWITIGGGSTFELGNPESRTIGSQISLMPYALMNSLLRPFLFEAHNALALFAALESTAILFFVIRALVREGPVRTVRLVGSSAVVVFAVVLVGVGLVGVGLGTGNLGALSRYRSPLMIFLWPILLVLNPTAFRTLRRRHLLALAATRSSTAAAADRRWFV